MTPKKAAPRTRAHRQLQAHKGFHRAEGARLPKGYGSLSQRRNGRLNEREEGDMRKAMGARSKSEDGHAVHLRVRWVHCGKPRCRTLHGPYVYEAWRGDDGKIHERYLGKAKLA